MPPALLKAVGLFVPDLKELKEISYQFTEPFEIDSSAATATFGLEATPLDDALATTVEWWRGQAS